MSVCFYGVYRDEAKHLPAMLEAASEFCDDYVLLEGGRSRDATRTIMQDWTDSHGGVVIEDTWNGTITPLQNRALEVARSSGCDYLITAGGGEIIRATEPLPELTEPVYAIPAVNGTTRWYLPLLVGADVPFTWQRSTHTCSIPMDNTTPRLDTLTIEDHAYGVRRQSKLKRDRRLLEEEHLESPGDSRTLFYLAQTYRALGDANKALAYYNLRAACEEFEEERWYAQFAAAQLTGNTHLLLSAWEARPTRAEPLYQLEMNYRGAGKDRLADEFARMRQEIPYPEGEILFVHGEAYANLPHSS